VTATQAPARPPAPAERDSFAETIRAEWTKFRTVRGWVIGMTVAALVTVLLGYLAAAGSLSSCSVNGQPCHIVHPVGPGGEAVTDSFYFVHQPLASHGSITARVTSLTGLLPTSTGGRVRAGQGPGSGLHPGIEPWSKGGLIIKAGTAQGSAYAAIMVTGGHGVRMQYDYTQDIAGPPGRPAPASPRWLRLTRAGDTITGYASADGRHWAQVGTAVLPGLAPAVQAGLFATSPAFNVTTAQGLLGTRGLGGPTLATAVFDQVSLHGGAPGSAWTGTQLGGGPSDAYAAGPGGYHQAGGTFRVTGSGDIAPDVPGGAGPGQTLDHTLVGALAGLIAVAVVATMFVTAEYRRGLIRTTFAASPRRGRVLAAKAVVIGVVSFVAGLAAAAVAIPLNSHVLRANGNYLYPASTLTVVRIAAGTAGLLAVAAVLALAIGAVLRRSAIAVTVVIAAIILPFLVAVTNVLPAGADTWLMRLVPAAGFAVQQAIPNYPQVSNACTVAQGCYPLAPWAGFAVLCAWAAAALGLALLLIRRRDA
jgi:ABC-type transport system involved in multi-copper enzyme maturation permease subunit